MYRLYTCRATAGFAPQMVLEEARLPHEIVEVDILTGAQRSPEFLRINPAGRVPALRLPDGQILTEASAICLYLADAHDLTDVAPAADDPDRALFLRSLIFLATSVQDHFKRYFYPQRYTTDPIGIPGIRTRGLEMVDEAFATVEAQLAGGGPYHLGPRSSAADLYLLMITTWHPAQDELYDRFPAIAHCCGLVAERPVIRDALSRQGEVRAAG
ncbi:glutathione S-transferase family protein [Pseudoruegeria sp. HB172150]|uniref:glutathione S-transferase family protein n=1 Tax=Pseudoruegeria sp. HB172150 TaxID=2721164 RepID=UPI0015561FF0|nr:glutathione S-transferase [Pseudoruegeria sp. HB172150]